MILIDCHTHTSGVSRCCKANAQEVIDTAKENGMDGIVLTNHYSMSYILEKRRYQNTVEMARAYIDEYYFAKEIGDRCGQRVWFGIELTMELYSQAHMLIYGVSEQFLIDHADMAYYTQEELYRAVRANGGVLVQAHPLRKAENVLLDLSLLDGLEINSHTLYKGTHYEELSKIAYDNGLILTSGGDYHADTPRSRCGMYLPESMEDSKALAEYLLSADKVRLLMQDTSDTEPYEKEFIRKK